MVTASADVLQMFWLIDNYVPLHLVLFLLHLLLMYRFTAEDNERDGYTYTVGICTAALTLRDSRGENVKSAGAVQVHKNTHTSQPRNIGSFEDAEIMSGSNCL